MELHKTDAQGGAVGLTADYVCDNLQTWLRDMISFLGDCSLSLARLREFAPFFIKTGKDRYQRLMMNHLSDHTRKPR